MSPSREHVLATPSGRSRRDGLRLLRRANLAMEPLEHRQLLATTFTGNVITDFPETDPNVVVVRPAPDDPRYSKPEIEPIIQDYVLVSGFQLDAIRMSYDAVEDVLYFGLEQPLNEKTNDRVIAGDADNNLNGGTVDPRVLAVVPPRYIDFPSLGGTESMLVFLDLDPPATGDTNLGDGVDIVAGIDNAANPNSIPGKAYQVAQFNQNANPNNPAAGTVFGTFLPEYTGGSRLGTSPEDGAFEFSIRNFSQLYKIETGKDLQFPARIAVGAFAGSQNDGGTSEAFIPGLITNVPTPPKPPIDCPPLSPPILINPHSKQHINTFHDTRIRVQIFGTYGFDVSQIDPATVRLGGAAPIFDQIRPINADQYADRLFVFNGLDVDLPRGGQDAVVTGFMLDGTPFVGAARVYNQPGFFTVPANDNTPVPLKRLPAAAAAASSQTLAQIRASHMAMDAAPATATATTPTTTGKTNVVATQTASARRIGVVPRNLSAGGVNVNLNQGDAPAVSGGLTGRKANLARAQEKLAVTQ